MVLSFLPGENGQHLIVRAESEFAAATLGPIRLREYADDLVARAQRRQRRQRKRRRACKRYAQRQYARRAPSVLAGLRELRSLRSLSSFLRMRSRFRSER